MATTDVAPIVEAIAARIELVDDIGIVHRHDPYDHNDLLVSIVSEIAGIPTLRVWWIAGPTMDSSRIIHTNHGAIERRWRYQIHGLEGLDASGACIEVLRANALAVSDSIDSSVDLGGTAHRSDPCVWVQQPELALSATGVAAARIQLVKTVITLSSP
jgi:hypothetical protein